MIRKARMDDVRQIHRLLQEYADQKLLLGRSISSLYDHLRDFVVWDEGSRNSSGVCSLPICLKNLAESRSSAVKETGQERGIGTGLVQLV